MSLVCETGATGGPFGMRRRRHLRVHGIPQLFPRPGRPRTAVEGGLSARRGASAGPARDPRGAECFTDIARFGEKKRALLRRFRPFKNGTPPHDRIGDIFAALDAEQFRRCFVAWVAKTTGVPEDVVAVDGKTVVRAARNRAPARQSMSCRPSPPADFVTIKHMAHNLLRTARGKDSMRLRRKVAAWDDEYLASILVQCVRSPDCPGR